MEFFLNKLIFLLSHQFFMHIESEDTHQTFNTLLANYWINQ